MAKIKWTNAQRLAIDDRGGTLLVSAAAGSGKTAVLSERVVALLQDPEHPVQADRLLIVTFTNAAAAELRARIAARLEQAIAEHPADNRLRRQKMLLQRAHICTIDAFCLSLLQQHFTALDLPPDFSMGDAGVIGRLKGQALAETLELAYTTPAFCDFANLYGKGRTDGAASAAVLQLYDFLRSLPFATQQKNWMRLPWQPEADFASSSWYQLIGQQLQLYARCGHQFAQSALTLCQEDCEEAKASAYESKKTAAAQQKAVGAVEKKYAAFFAVLEGLQDAFQSVLHLGKSAADWDALYNTLAPYQQGKTPMPGFKNTGLRLSGNNKTRVKLQADQASELFGLICALVPCNTSQEATDRATALPMLDALFAAEQQFEQLFYQKKTEKKMLEFSDLEHLALQLLAEENGTRTPLAASISDAFDVIMVDEYQDTNGLQEELYRRLANVQGDNLFFVGDLKQSIYRFRQADPMIFAQKQQAYPLLDATVAARALPPEGQAGTPALLALDANFRSAPAVVDGINFIFGQVMNPLVGGVEYGQGQRLVCKGASQGFEGQVGLLLDLEGEQDPQQVAAKIEQLVALGAAGDATGMVRQGDALRAVQYEDCCILLATRKSFGKYAEALAARGIPTYADSAENLLEASHIQPLIALLQIIDNPAQDIPLTTAMLSVIFGFTEDDLLALRLRCKQGSLYGAVAQIAEQARRTLSDDAAMSLDAFGQKVLSFYESLAAMRRLSHTLAPEELLAEIFARTHYLALVGAMENGARRREDVSKFAGYVATAGVNGIESLVHHMAQTQASGGLVDTAPGRAKPGCVTIMTIHRSKGLQFPVVFVADLDHRFNTDDLKKKIQLNRMLGIGLQLRMGEQGSNYQTIASVALRCIEKQELLSEAMRLLYVALTRAQDHLYMTGERKTLYKQLASLAYAHQDGVENLYIQQASCFLDWVLLALIKHPSAALLRAELGEGGVGLEQADYPLQVEVVGVLESPPVRAASGVLQSAPDAALVEALLAGFAWQYPHTALTDLPAKVSVTSLVHKEQRTLLQRPAFLAKDGMTAAEKGTALHAFLENADFAALKEARAQGKDTLRAALLAERTRQETEQRMLPELAEKLEMASVEAFFMGEAFRRIAHASEIYREYAFITGLPAAEVLAATSECAQMPPTADATVLVQGIADLLLVYPDHLELLDYKSDHGKNEAAYRQAYAKQLAYYARAIEKRFAPLPLTYQAIYSFDLDKLIVVDETDAI